MTTISTVPATTSGSATDIPAPTLPAFPTISPEVVAAIAAAVVPQVVAAISPSLATPAPVVTATTGKATKAQRKADKAARQAAAASTGEAVEMVTYRKDHSGLVRTGTRKQFEARRVNAARLGHTLTLISSEIVRKAVRVQSAQSTPAAVVTATDSKAGRKAANKALAAALRAQGLNPGDPQVWAAAQAQANA